MGQVSVPLIAATTPDSRVFLVLVVLGSLLLQQQRLAWAVLSLFSATLLSTSDKAFGMEGLWLMAGVGHSGLFLRPV